MRRVSLILMSLLMLTVSGFTQVTLTADDIPNEPGAVSWFYVEADTLQGDTLGIPVTISQPGPDQEWDFTVGNFQAIERDSLFDPATTAYADSFPTANRGQFSSAFFGLGFGDSELGRFEHIDEDGWGLVGLTVAFSIGGGPAPTVPIAFEPALPITPFPVEMGDSWTLTNTLETTYEDTASGAEFLIRFEYGGASTADAWGNATFEGGQSECLRVRTSFSGTLNVYPIIFGFPSPIPIFTQEFPASIAYNWMAPEIGMLATITSMPGEDQEVFDQASSIRRRTLTPTAVGETRDELPTRITLAPAWPNPFNAMTTIRFSTPAEQQVRVAVYNLLGQRVAMLANRHFAPGSHQLSWQPANEASGLYLLRFETGAQVQTQRLLLLK